MEFATTFVSNGKLYHYRYALGEIVYHRLVSERSPGMVTGLFACPHGIGYRVTWEDLMERSHYEMELSSEFIPHYGEIKGED